MERFRGRSFSAAPTCAAAPPASVATTNREMSRPTRFTRNYKQDNGIDFPWQIEIARPQEEYDITLNIVKLDLNQPLPDDKFILEQPAGAEVVHLDKPEAQSSSGPQGER